MNLLQLSWKNLINKPLNMTLSLVLFALGVGLISLLLVLNKQLQDNFDKNLAGIDLIIGAKGSPLQMILCSMYHIDNPTGNVSIKEIKPFLNPKHPLIEKAVPMSMGDSHKGYRIVGTNHDLLEFYNAKVGEGSAWSKTMEVTIGAVVANELNMKIGDTFKSSHGLVRDDNLVHDDSEDLKVVGVLQPTGSVIDQLILTNTQSIWAVHEGHAHDMENDSLAHNHSDAPKSLLEEDETKEITSVLIKFKGHNYQALNMGRSINENTDMQAATPAIELNRLHSQMDIGTKALNMLAWIIVFVSGLSVFISLFSSLKDRKYELALMRVMGATPGKLFILILLEGLMLAVLGYIIGMAMGHIGMEILAGHMRDTYRYSFSGKEFLTEEFYVLIGALGVGLLAAIIPAFQARNTDISETLSKG
jgi:putative ABC transport system permease protein